MLLKNATYNVNTHTFKFPTKFALFLKATAHFAKINVD